MFFLQLIALLILVHFFEKIYTLLGEDTGKKVVTLEENLDLSTDGDKDVGNFYEKIG